MANAIRRSAAPRAESIGTRKLADLLQAATSVQITINGTRYEIAPETGAVLLSACKAVAEPQQQEMTTIEAAEFLDVSRPFVVKLVKRGKLPCRMVGTHRRIPMASLRIYKEEMFQRARAACDEMTSEAEASGLYDDDLERPAARHS